MPSSGRAVPIACRVLIWLVLASALVSPAFGQAPVPVEVDIVGIVDGRVRAEYVQVLERAIAYYQQEFGEFPRPAVRARLYQDASALRQGLTEAGLSEADAALFARTVTSFVYRGVIHTNAGRLVERRTRLTLHVPHELMHVMQGGWTRGGQGPQWIREGMADVWAARFEDAMKIQSYERFRQSRVEAVREKRSVLATVPLTLDLMLWNRLTESIGTASNGISAVYAWGALLYERLEASTSRTAVITFLGLPKTGPDLETAFEQAFQMRVTEFEAAMRAYFQAL